MSDAPPLAAVSVTSGPEGVLATVTGEVDLSNSAQVAAQLEAAAPGGRMVLDLAGVRYLDTSAVRAVVALAGRPGTELVVVAPRGSVVRAVLAVTRLDTRLDVREERPTPSS